MIFDWGGTLTPWRAVDHRAAWRSYADVLHPDDVDTATQVAAAIVAAEAAAWQVAREEHRAFTIAQVLEAAATPLHEAGIVAYRTFWEHATHTDPEVEPLVKALRAKGLRIGILSSTSWPAAWHEEVLERDGVRDLFHARVWSSDLEYTKPHAAAFHAAMTALGVDDPADCVYVGDRLYDDISGAKAAGMRAVLVPHTVIPPDQQVAVDVEPDAVVQRLAEVEEVVDRWRS